MADINLLGSDNQKYNFAQNGASLGIKIFTVILLLVLAYYVYLRFAISRTQSSIQETQTKTSQVESDALSRTDRMEAITRQGQVKAVNTVINKHVYWAGFLPELARVTLKSATYAAFTADTTGALSVDITIPNYAEADKYIQVFDLPQFNQQFSDVKILSIGKAQQGSTVQTQMKLDLKFDPQFIHKSLQ